MIKIFASLFRVKSVDHILTESQKSGQKLKRTLSGLDLITLGMGAIIGAGIFATIGTAAAGDLHRPGAGPALMLSFVITAIACGFSALCYAEFAAMVPIAGSAYTYSYATLGELVAWIIGWDLIIEYAIGNVAVAISWSGYFGELLAGFGIYLPKWMTFDIRSAIGSDMKILGINPEGLGFWDSVNFVFSKPEAITPDLIIANAPHIGSLPIVFNLPAVAIVVCLTTLIIIGIKESTRFNQIMVGIKLIVLAFFCVVGFFYIRPENYTPFAPNGLAGIQAGAAIIFFAYIGFDAVSTLAEETKDPGRNLPIGIVGSLLICTAIYVGVTAVFVGLIPYEALGDTLAKEKAEPLTLALKYVAQTDTKGIFSERFMDFAAGLVAFGSVVAHTAVLLVFQIGQPRILFSMSRDGLLPRALMKVHKKFKTPYVATILTGLFVVTFSAFMNIEEMVDLCNIGTLFAFVLVCISIIVLRYKEPERERPFKIAGGPLVPILGISACFYLMTGLPVTTWIRFGVWLVIGICVYMVYGRRRSMLIPENVEKARALEADAEVLEDMDHF